MPLACCHRGLDSHNPKVVKIVVGVTNRPWFDYLAGIEPDDVNFRQPSGSGEFKVLQLGDLFRLQIKGIVHPLGLALGGRPAASFAQRLMLPVSNDTLLRVVRRRARVPEEPLMVIGNDDFAWRRNHRYGTIVCDLARRRPVTLLPDRASATSEAWLGRHQSIVVVARDRGGGYGEARR